MGAHEVPVEHRSDRARYVDLVVDEMIPAVAAARLAEWCDVFCETGVFTADESRTDPRVAGQRAGLKARIHADELGASGGSQVAAAVGARSADHLIFVPPDGIAAMARADVVATLLPTRGVLPQARALRAGARSLIDAGVPVALATDVNPGGGFSPSMPFAMTLACFAMGLTFEEALTAAHHQRRVVARPRARGRQPRAWKARRRRARPRRRHGSAACPTAGISAIAGVLKRGHRRRRRDQESPHDADAARP